MVHFLMNKHVLSNYLFTERFHIRPRKSLWSKFNVVPQFPVSISIRQCWPRARAYYYFGTYCSWQKQRTLGRVRVIRVWAAAARWRAVNRPSYLPDVNNPIATSRVFSSNALNNMATESQLQLYLFSQTNKLVHEVQK